MKKGIIFITSIIILLQNNQVYTISKFSKTQSVEIGPLEQQDAPSICKYECDKKNLIWNNKWCCLYSPEIKQHNCVCQCIKK